MAKTKISEYDSTAANNTDIDGINIAESCAPSGINNAIREQMAHLKDGLGAGTPVFLDQTNNRVGIGTTSPSTKLSVFDSSGGNVASFTDTSSADLFINLSSGVSLLTPSTGTLAFGTNNSEKMRVDTNGAVLVNKTTNAQQSGAGHAFLSDGRYFSVSSNSTSSQETLTVFSTGASAFRFFVDYAGTVHATSTSISAISDQRLKENITDLETGLNEVLALKPRRFDWKNGDGKNIAGFIAQEVETVLPDLVDGFLHTELSDAKGLKMGDILPTAIKAIQELSAKVDALETENTAIKARLDALEG